MRAGEFLRFIWGSALLSPVIPGVVTIWRATDKASLHYPLEALRDPLEPEEDEELFDLFGRENLYAHPGLRRADIADRETKSGILPRGGKKDVVALGAFILDIDVASPEGAHKASNDVLPKNEDDVIDILSVAPEPPSLVVMSGYGYQPCWVFDKPIWIATQGDRLLAEKAYERFEAPFLARARQLGFHVDSCATIDHQFRLPGTLNVKRKGRGEVREVTVIDGTFERYDNLVSTKTTVSVSAAIVSSTTAIEQSVDISPVLQWMKKLKPDHKNKQMIDAVLAGESFAEVNRDNAMQAVCSTIAWLAPARRPEMTPEILAEILRPSLSVWAAELNAEKSLEEEIDKAIVKFESAFLNREEEDARRFEDAAAIRRGLRMAGEEVTEEQVNGTARFFSIIQTSNASYVWNFAKGEIPYAHTGYHGPIKDTQLFNVCKDFWENVSEGYTLKTYNRGEEKNKGVKQILDEYGSAALKLEGHLTLQESYFDIESRTFHEAMCPFRVMGAERDPDIEEWLALFGHTNHMKLLDWMATIPRLEEPNSALYLEGVKDVGKDLFASGVARLWRTTGPSLYERVSERFNKDMFECPFIWLNEGVDGAPRASSSFIRRLVSATGHSCERKGMDVQPVLGSIRLYIAANNDNVLHALASEDLGEADLDAVTQRFLHVKSSPEAALYLESKKEHLKSWVRDDRIARHVLYLAESRSVTAGRKFLVDGEQSDVHRALLNRGDRNEVVLEWLANFLEKPSRIAQIYTGKNQSPLAAVGDGGIFVNTKAFVDNQNFFRTVEAKLFLLPGVASRILARLSGGRQRRLGENRDRYHAINPERVLEWAERTQVGDVEVMRENLQMPLKMEGDE